ncbi:MAG: ribosomal RNA small subunit methyltransferase A, partial [Elusimicrobia bacterium]|nr:ribosomal RNA small subunit methyltransferase A [Elusimicrobiota bacterium]
PLPGVRARYDQHFLADPAAADRIVAAAAPSAGERVLEVGPGRGILTERLLAAGARVLAVEIDERLAAELSARLQGRENFELRRADFLELELAALPAPVKIVSNLPYSVATPILQHLLPWPGWTEAVLMFQKEVAERIQAGPGSRDYGVLSVSVALFAEASRVFDLGRYAFRPPPKVESSVVRLRRLPRPRAPEGLAPESILRVAKAAFSQRRKMAANPLASVLGFSRETVAAALTRTGIAPQARAEDISLDQYSRLTLALK